MKSLTILWILVLIPWVNSCCGATCASSIPDKARKVISTFNDWKVLKLSDLPKDDQTLWTKSHDGRCPGIAPGNFSEDKRSYAVALVQGQLPGELQEQLIILVPEGGSFRYSEIVSPTTVVSPFVVWKVPPGKYKGIDQKNAVQILHDSFVYEKMEAYATQYYYDEGRLHSIVTAN